MYFSNIANDKLKKALLFSFPRSSLISPTLSPHHHMFLGSRGATRTVWRRHTTKWRACWSNSGYKKEGWVQISQLVKLKSKCFVRVYFPLKFWLLMIKKYMRRNSGFPFILKLIWEVFHLTTASGSPLSLIREILNISTINHVIIFVSLL